MSSRTSSSIGRLRSPTAALFVVQGSAGPTWGETWALLQPTGAERKMDPRVVAASDDEVVVLWQQRGMSAAGERFEGAPPQSYQLAINQSYGSLF